MSANPPDPETLAAFLDGGLSAQERDDVLRAIARSADVYETFVEAAAIQIALAAAAREHAEASTVAIAGGRAPARRSRRIPAWTLLPLAAGLAALLLVPPVARSRVDPNDPQALIRKTAWIQDARRGAADPAIAVSMSAINWPAIRGADAPALVRRVAFRAGVLLVNQNLAVDLGDTSAAVRSVGELLVAELGRVRGGGPAAAQITHAQQQRAGDHALGREAQRGAAREVRTLFSDSPWFSLGIWIGQARLALAVGDSSFFTTESPAPATLEKIRNRLAAEGELQNDAIASAGLDEVTALLDRLNGRLPNDSAATSASVAEILRLAGGDH